MQAKEFASILPPDAALFSLLRGFKYYIAMSLTKAQQKAYQKMKEQKNAKPAGTSAEGKAKSKADSEAHICQVST